MPVSLDCPRCKRPLSVPESRAGSYIHCPRCRGRLWVPSEEERREMANGPAPLRDSRAGPRRPGPDSPIPLGSAFPIRSGSSPLPAPERSLPALAVQPVRPAAVARFISAAPADSCLKLAEDGRLPELRLPEPRTALAREPGRAGWNPLVMAGLCCLSAVASLALVLMPDASDGSARTREQQRARAAIEADYFSDRDGLPHQPYQFQLREAHRAYLRGDYRQEREVYRRLLGTLRAERKPPQGITGSPRRDQELEQLLIVLLGSGS